MPRLPHKAVISDYIDVLESHDDPWHGEEPAVFNRAEAQRSFVAFVEELSSRLGETLTFETGVHIQDASFHSQLFLGTGALRFSAFGRMIAFTPDIELPDETLEQVTRLAAERGYVLIPTEVLETDYLGAHPGVTGIETWWIRYFDWL